MARSNSKLNWTWSWQFNQALRYSFRNGDVRERSWTKQVKWYDGDWREYYLPCRSYRVACPRDLCNQQGKRHWSMNGYGYFILTWYLIRWVHGVIFYLWVAPVSDPNQDGYETDIFFNPTGTRYFTIAIILCCEQVKMCSFIILTMTCSDCWTWTLLLGYLKYLLNINFEYVYIMFYSLN
jgi:hypothetical protein